MKFVFIILILFQIINPKDVAALTNCKGSIKSDTQIDYSKIRAKLFTAQGNLKHEAECNSGNGYFFIPIDNEGKYLIKLSTPEGWIFVPELHEVEIVNDGECPSELNFKLAGFQIKGAIQNGQNSHLELGLYQGTNNKFIEKTKIDGNGEYNFTAKPGQYVISPISGSSSEHCVDQGSIDVEIVDEPVRVKPDIRVAGHNLKVQLNDEKGNPLPSATAILVAEKEIKNLPINSERPMASNRAQKWFYSLKTTDSTGIVMFYCIPPGKYSINGELKRQTMEAHFEKKQIEINSKAAEVKISINAFTLNGKVIIGQKPIVGVKISIDGTFKVETDGNGKFELAKISPGKHIIGGEKQNYEFNKMEIIGNIEMEKEILLSPKRMAIAGNVISSEKLTLPISFQLKKLDGNDGEVQRKFETGNDGKFYEMIEPGKYSLKPLSSIPFSPNEFAINLMESPVLDVKFIQYKAKVGGRVKCFLGKCNKIWMEIWQQEEEAENYVTKLQIPSNGTFLFDEVLPGNYKLKIVDQENIWWAEEEIGIEIMDKDLVDINFEQKGYRLNIQTTHPVKMAPGPYYIRPILQENKFNSSSFSVEIVENYCSLTAITACLIRGIHFFFSTHIIVAWVILSFMLSIFQFKGTDSYKRLKKTHEVPRENVDKSKIASVIHIFKFIFCVFVCPFVFLMDFLSGLFTGESSISDKIKLTICLTIHGEYIDELERKKANGNGGNSNGGG